MSTMTREQWIKGNQEYLAAAINGVKAELELYRKLREGKDPTEEEQRAMELTRHQMDLLEETLPVNPPLRSLVEAFQLSSFEEKLLLMSVGVELDAQFAQLMVALHGSSSQKLPTFSLALAACSDAHWSALTPEAPLRYWRLIEMNRGPLLTESPFAVDEFVLHFLSGINAPDHRLKDLVKVFEPSGELVSSHRDLSDTLAEILSRLDDKATYPLLQLRGGSAEDHLAIVAEAFSRYRFMTCRLPLQFLPNGTEELFNLTLLWNRTAALNRSVLYLDGSQLGDMDQKGKARISHFMENLQGMAVLGSDQKLDGISRGVLTLEITKPLRQEQKMLWKQHLGPAAESMDREMDQIVTQFNLDPHTIKQLAGLASAGVHANGSGQGTVSELKKKVWNACCQHTRPNLENLAQRIEPLAEWDDLVMPELQKTILREISVHVEQRQKVYEEWGFAGKSRRGLGISALFSGESGTGKTMASEVLANALRLDLYRIDLSQVVNKYIGETEKNLKKIFDAAEESGAILLFDEADALFGKRSEVKDSHDRYSNIEVSYLLQKMEAYRGLAILTTNMKNALDKAFLRRIRFVVQFPFPDRQMRAEIWKKAFPAQTPTADLNIHQLATLNITGGNIRNIALNASFTAAGKGRPVSMSDLQHAARMEYVKLEKQMSAAESLI